MNLLKNPLSVIQRFADVAFALAIGLVIGLMLMPVSPVVLDSLLAVNLGTAILCLMVVIYTPDVSRLATFPTILLLGTLFRLALNVCSTRLILTDGEGGSAKAGHVIEALGTFVAGNEPVVGAVIFIVLTLIQFLVVAKGAERVAEVSARFTLDAMPGKQMAIDADLRSGFITEADARIRRGTLEKESRLYGAMDGAMKFVKGDAIAGILICIINVLGGIAIGASRSDGAIDWGDILSTYTLLTIGDGLVAQIPSLIMCIAAGLVVTRVTDGNDNGSGRLARDLLGEIIAHPRSLWVAAGLLTLVGASSPWTGFPWPPFLGLGAVIGSLGWMQSASQKKKALSATGRSNGPAAPKPKLVRWDVPILVELGPDLANRWGMTTDNLPSSLLEPIEALHEVCQFYGLPPRRVVTVRAENSKTPISKTMCRISVFGNHVASLDLPADRLIIAGNLSIEDSQELGATSLSCIGGLRGYSTVAKDHQAKLTNKGIEAMDEAMLLRRFFDLSIRRNLADLYRIQDLADQIELLQQKRAEVVECVTPKLFSLAQVHELLVQLLREQVTIRDLPRILAAMATAPGKLQSPGGDSLLALVRAPLIRTICSDLAFDGVVRVLTLAKDVEDLVRSATDYPEHGDDIRCAVGAFVNPRQLSRPVLVVDNDIREPLVQLLLPVLPEIAVLSMHEYELSCASIGYLSQGTIRLPPAPISATPSLPASA